MKNKIGIFLHIYNKISLTMNAKIHRKDRSSIKTLNLPKTAENNFNTNKCF